MARSKGARVAFSSSTSSWVALANANSAPDRRAAMPPFTYRCPSTGHDVQGFTAEEISENDTDDYLTTLCIKCQQVHLVIPATGEVLEEKDE